MDDRSPAPDVRIGSLGILEGERHGRIYHAQPLLTTSQGRAWQLKSGARIDWPEPKLRLVAFIDAAV